MRLKEFLEDNSPMGGRHDQLLRWVTASRKKEALELIAPEARHAVGVEVIPQLEDAITNVETLAGLVSTTKGELIHGFKSKNEVYTRLIQYKSIAQSDSQYEEDILAALDEWSEHTQKIIQEDVVPTPNDKLKESYDEDEEDNDAEEEPPFDLNDIIL
jgi:hypothetical protein